jgi:drug/metabolite transporter (DMT)-like permease
VFPLVTVLLSKLVLNSVITPRIVGGTVLTVAGVALVLAG